MAAAAAAAARAAASVVQLRGSLARNVQLPVCCRWRCFIAIQTANARVPLVDNDDNDDNADDASRLGLPTTACAARCGWRLGKPAVDGKLLHDYEDARYARHNRRHLQFMHSPSLLSFEENRFLARP
jgi:hypothetical protein